MRTHLAIFKNEIISQIFKGKKSIETRFSIKRIPPFGFVSIGDLVYIKPPGEEVKGSFTVKKVISIEGMEKNDWEYIKKDLALFLGFKNPESQKEYFKKREKAKYATIIYLDSIKQFIASPIAVSKSNLSGWMVLD